MSFLAFFRSYYEHYLKTALVSSRSKENPPQTTVPVPMTIDQKEGDQRFHCQKCSKSYKNKRHLYRHEKEECIDVVPRFKCVLCLNMFRRKYHLVRHMNNKHGLDLK